MLVWEEPLKSDKNDSAGHNSTHKMWREAFLRKLSRSGLLHEKVSEHHESEVSGPPYQMYMVKRVVCLCPERSSEGEDQDLFHSAQCSVECPLLLR